MAAVKVNPGRFVHAFRFEKFSKSANTSGGNAESFELICNARGLWENISGDTSYDAGLHVLITVYRVTTWWRSALESEVNKDTRLIYEGRVYRIESMQRIGENRQYYQFTVSEAH